MSTWGVMAVIAGDKVHVVTGGALSYDNGDRQVQKAISKKLADMPIDGDIKQNLIEAATSYQKDFYKAAGHVGYNRLDYREYPYDPEHGGWSPDIEGDAGQYAYIRNLNDSAVYSRDNRVFALDKDEVAIMDWDCSHKFVKNALPMGNLSKDQEYNLKPIVDIQFVPADEVTKTLSKQDFINDIKNGNISMRMIGGHIYDTAKKYKDTSPEQYQNQRSDRRVSKIQSNAIYLENSNGKESRLDIPPASLMDYTGDRLRVYEPGVRELNTEEKKNYLEIKAKHLGNFSYHAEQSEFKTSSTPWLADQETKGKKLLSNPVYINPDGSFTEYRVKGVNDKFPLYMTPEGEIKVGEFDKYDENHLRPVFIRDNSIRGELLFEYEIIKGQDLSQELTGLFKELTDLAKEYADMPATMTALKNSLSFTGLHIDGDKVQIEAPNGEMFSPDKYPYKESLINNLKLVVQNVRATAELEKNRDSQITQQIKETNKEHKERDNKRDLGTDR